MSVEIEMMSGMPNWGPSHQTTRGASKNTTRKRLLGVILFLALLGLGNGAAKGESTGTVISGLVILAAIAWLLIPNRVKQLIRTPFRGRQRPETRVRVSGDPLEAVRGAADQHGGGVYLGGVERGGWRHARPERAVLLLGPPRSGEDDRGDDPRRLVAHRAGGCRVNKTGCREGDPAGAVTRRADLGV